MASKFTANSIVFLLLTVFTVAVAGVFRHPLLIYTAVFLVTTNIVLFFWSQQSVRGLEVERRMPRLAVADYATEVGFKLINRGASPRFGLLGYNLHGKLTPGSDFSSVAFLSAPPGEVSEAAYHLTPLRSGVFNIGPFYVYGGDPFGFYKNWRKAADTAELTVLPNPVSFRLPRQSSASLIALDELETVAASGESTEFMGVREYRPGEQLRRVHWPTTARLGRLISRQYEMNVSAALSVLMVLDPSMLRGGFADNPKEYSLRMVAGLARATIHDNFHLSFMGAAGAQFSALAGSGYSFYQQLSVQLAQFDGEAPADWDAISRRVVYHLPKRSNLVVFVSELSEDSRMWLRQFAAHFRALSVVSFQPPELRPGSAQRQRHARVHRRRLSRA